MATAPYIRDAVRVKAALKEMPDGRIVANGNVKILSPTRYAEKRLSSVGLDVYILGIFAWVVDEKYYGVSLINAMIPIDPVQTNRVRIKGEEFFEFVFEPGGTVVKSVDLVCNDVLTYHIYRELFAQGNIPWYLQYEELRQVFDTAMKHANAPVGQQQEVTALIVSRIARSVHDRTKDYRTVVKSTKDLVENPPFFIPLSSVRLGATNTLTKLAGSYFSQGLTSALLHPSERPERIEELLLR